MSEVIGKIIVLNDTETVGSAGTFKKRLVVVETSEQYAQKVPIDFVQDKCSVLDNYKVGDNVTVSINIRGNEYNGKYYVSLNGWKISKAETQSESAPEAPQQEEESDDLEF
jgi:hypothetical protein